MTEIGATLREARMRARIDVSELEAKTKIRAKYLRALENEEWDLLPGPTFVRSFLRTYAQALGLDGRVLVEEYRLRCEPPSELEHQPTSTGAPRPRRSGPARIDRQAPSRGYLLALVGVCTVILLLIVALATGGGGSSPKAASSTTHGKRDSARDRARTSGSARHLSAPALVALSLQPTAPVYVCLIGDDARKLIAGVTIEPPYTPITYHARHFDITLGNNAVTLYIDGNPLTVPPSSTAIGYSISPAGAHPLEAGELPTCK